MSDTTTTTATIDQLYAGLQPVNKQTDSVEIADSQTLERGAAIGIAKYGAIAVEENDGTETNTGDGTCTDAATVVSAIKPIVGVYTLTCTGETANGGTFKLEDPNGDLIADNLVMDAGAGAATVFSVGGLTFELTDGAEDFDADDYFTLTLAAGSGEGILVDKTAVDGSNEIYGVLTEAVTTDGATQHATVDLTGTFNAAAVSFADGTDYEDVEDDARNKGIYFKAVSF